MGKKKLTRGTSIRTMKAHNMKGGLQPPQDDDDGKDKMPELYMHAWMQTLLIPIHKPFAIQITIKEILLGKY